jgi:succinate dehydrogenase/fumarate reductase cytochrome b subunit
VNALCRWHVATVIHMQRIQHRPISPDVLDINNKGLHYKMEIQAISSIMTRATGVTMTLGEPFLLSASVLAICFHVA